MLSRCRPIGLVLLLVLPLAASCGPTPVSLLRPNGVAVAADGSLYVMDRGNYRVVHLAADGRFLGAFGKLGTAPGDIYSGWDIALDAAGNIYIGNLNRDETGEVIHDGIKAFSPEGRFLREVGGQDYSYEESGRVPYGLEIDAAGRVYVADYGQDALRVFDPQGEVLGTFFGETGSAEGEFWGLNDVAVDDRRDLVYLCDNINSRIQQFTRTVFPTGGITLTPRLTFGSYGPELGQLSYPQYLAVDESSGRLYVNDMANYRIQVFDSQGRPLAAFAPPEVSAWQGMGLAVGPDGAVYVADALNNAVWVFEPDGRLRAKVEAH